MKSVIMIAYYFPPEGSAGSFRPLRFVRHLPRMGWRGSVVTADPYAYERYDSELLKHVPIETEVVRVRGRDLWQSLQSWRGEQIKATISNGSAATVEQIRALHCKPLRSRIRRAVRIAECFYYYPDAAKHWIRPAVAATAKLCVRNRSDVIWATAGPVTAWVVARQASENTGVPYVLDLRDPHGLSFYDAEIHIPEWAKRRIKRVMSYLFKGARSVVFLSESVAESYYRAFAEALDPARIHIIPNGYEGTIESFICPPATNFTLLYAGTLATYRYDTLLRALVLLKKSDPVKARRLRLLFVGEGFEGLVKDAEALGVCDNLETMGPTSQAEINRLQSESHALLILGRLPTIKGYELFAGAKLFNYLKARRPILGVLPQDETRRILEHVGVSTVADVESAPEIAAILRKLMDAWAQGDLVSVLPDRIKSECFSAERQVEDFSTALLGAQPRKPFVPGSIEVPASLRQEVFNSYSRANHVGWVGARRS